MNKIDNIPCVILSGGRSSRMGEDKSFLSFGNYNTLIEYQYNKLSKIFSNIYVSTKTDKFNFTNNMNLILDNDKNISSPMVALQSIFNKLSNNKIFIITVDIPLIETSTILKLIENSKEFDITIAIDKDKQHNLCGVFSHTIANNVNNLLSKDIHKINYLIKQTNNYKEIYFKNQSQFININNIDDYKKAKLISNSYI
ncbi:MAG: molybdenum cofactor guanylyltransferase MobA [Campylobacterota bacterium]|nr:molybdenum cofactor guanylyltransferase MobA [Campylobacterota bacterium]